MEEGVLQVNHHIVNENESRNQCPREGSKTLHQQEESIFPYGRKPPPLWRNPLPPPHSREEDVEIGNRDYGEESEEEKSHAIMVGGVPHIAEQIAQNQKPHQLTDFRKAQVPCIDFLVPVPGIDNLLVCLIQGIEEGRNLLHQAPRKEHQGGHRPMGKRIEDIGYSIENIYQDEPMLQGIPVEEFPYQVCEGDESDVHQREEGAHIHNGVSRLQHVQGHEIPDYQLGRNEGVV